VLLSRQDTVREFSPDDTAGAARDAKGIADHSYLVRSCGVRAGALFAGHVSQGNGGAACRLAYRDSRDRPVARGSGKSALRYLLAVRSAAWPADPASDPLFRPDRRFLADRARASRHGAIPAVQSARRLQSAWRVRRRLLPQRADLFRS